MTTPLYDAHGHTIQHYSDHVYTVDEFLAELSTTSDIPDNDFNAYNEALFTAWQHMTDPASPGYNLIAPGHFKIINYAPDNYFVPVPPE